MKKISEKTPLEDLIGIIVSHLENRNISVVLVGGAAVSMYTDNKYMSKDIDFISSDDHKKITSAMAELGFKSDGKDFYHPNTSFTVEFPSGPLGIGDQVPIKPEGRIKINGTSVKVFSPTQSIMDRLAWFYYSNDRQCLDQAVMIYLDHLQSVDLKKVKEWSKAEGQVEKFNIFMEHINRLSASKCIEEG